VPRGSITEVDANHLAINAHPDTVEAARGLTDRDGDALLLTAPDGGMLRYSNWLRGSWYRRPLLRVSAGW
jgi:hypothetical protein